MPASLNSYKLGGNEVSSLHLDFGPFYKLLCVCVCVCVCVYVCVWQCHRSEGGVEDLFTSLILKFSCKNANVTLHCTENL